MLADLKPIFGKVLVILIIVLVYYLIKKYSTIELFEDTIETFEDTIDNEKHNYLKLKETYIKSSHTNDTNNKTLDILYSNHVDNEDNENNEDNKNTKEQTGNWKNKTLNQCIDTCNKLDKCIGFSRDNVLDTEPAHCHPRINSSHCYSNRKGDYKQISNAINYNTYIKADTPNIINNCIGDEDITLNRIIFIKTYSNPNNYLGYNNDARVQMIDKDTTNVKVKCSFRIEAGKEGSGTVSFLHIDTNNYLCRDKNNELIFKELNKNFTENKQRCSFNINDGLTNGIIFKALPIEGEVVDKYITLNNNYLKISSKSKTNKLDLFTFYIVDTIDNTTIITNKTKMNKSNNKNTQSNNQRNNSNTTGDTSTKINKSSNTSNSKMNNTINEAFTINLDNNNSLPLYNNLFNENNNNNNNNIKIDNYLEDNYLNKEHKNDLMKITKKLNESILDKTLKQSINKNQTEYNTIYELNKEIESKISEDNLNINKTHDTISHHLNKMRIKDLANDYFFIKSIALNK